MLSETHSGGGADWGQASSSATIVCSDCARNGKTLFAKLVTDLLHLRKGAVPHIFDTDDPNGSLLGHFPGSGEVINIGQTRQQVALFDGMLSNPEGHFVVDLSARHQAAFFKIMDDIGFESGADQVGLDVSIFYLIDRRATSIEGAAQLARSFPQTRLVPVRSAAIGDALEDWHVAEVYKNMRHQREILLPELSDEALEMLEHPEFHFDTFVAGHYEHFPFELKAELWGFLESLYEQRESTDDGTTHPI